MRRFARILGEDYKLFKLACPHHDKLEETIGKEISKIFKESPKEEIKVLEVGCGTGITTEIILNSNSRTHITALDNEQVMIKQAKENLQNYGNRAFLIQTDALDFLYKQKKDFFDIVASAFTIHNFSQEYRGKFLIEVFRILKKGGLFVNADKYALDNEKEHIKSLNWQIDKIKKVYTKAGREDLAEAWIKHYNRDNKKDLIMLEGESIIQLKEIGFINIKKTFRNQMEAIIIARK